MRKLTEVQIFLELALKIKRIYFVRILYKIRLSRKYKLKAVSTYKLIYRNILILFETIVNYIRLTSRFLYSS